MKATSTEIRIQTICLLILSIISVALGLFLVRPVMIPFTLALFFTFMLDPLIDIQLKYFKIPRLLAIFTTLIIGFIILLTFLALISTSIQQMATNFDSYQDKVENLLRDGANNLNLERFGINPKELITPFFSNINKSVGGIVFGTINTLVKLLSQGILILIFVIFLLIGKKKNISPKDSVWKEIEIRVKRYISTKFLLSMITGILVGVTLSLLNIDLALVFGLLAFLLNFIPSIGSIIATLLPLPVVIVSPDISSFIAISAIAMPGIIQFSIGNVIEPKIMGDSLDLHPVAILMALIFWGMIWGLVGMLLAAPLTAIMKIIFEKIEYTSPLANLLAGRIE
ncbi:MAG: AI-2E family transporter [Candidatus Omnitrophica bacterium]|nr:AI-2E family transporter [Candidatus Omnitrophota bacterium]MCB9747488.1 AI-2E family transporter [Candidatus Omnitrophota bacterium]